MQLDTKSELTRLKNSHIIILLKMYLQQFSFKKKNQNYKVKSEGFVIWKLVTFCCFIFLGN